MRGARRRPGARSGATRTAGARTAGATAAYKAVARVGRAMAPPSRPDARATAVDVAALLAVAGLLLVVHWLVPPGVREGLALQYDRPDPLHALTAAYVHLDATHLRGNVTAFLVASGSAYLLARVADERRWFHLAALGFLTALPMAVGMTAAVIVGGGVVARGFSGVVAAFVGFVLVSPGVVLRRAFGLPAWAGWNAVAALTVVVGAEILWVVGRSVPPAIGLVLAVGLVATLVPVVRPALDASNRPAGRQDWARLVGAAATVGVVAVVVSTFVVGLFPADVVNEDSVTNILGHYLGLVYGGVLALWGSRYWTTPGSRSFEGEDGSGGASGAAGERDGPGNRRS